MTTSFGAHLKQLRTTRQLTLRKFAEMIPMDASNYSKLERGEAAAPSELVLSRIATALGISPGVDDEWDELVSLAELSRGELPSDIMRRERVAALMPAFFATIRQTDDTEIDLTKLFMILQGVITGQAAGSESTTGAHTPSRR